MADTRDAKHPSPDLDHWDLQLLEQHKARPAASPPPVVTPIPTGPCSAIDEETMRRVTDAVRRVLVESGKGNAGDDMKAILAAVGSRLVQQSQQREAPVALDGRQTIDREYYMTGQVAPPCSDGGRPCAPVPAMDDRPTVVRRDGGSHVDPRGMIRFKNSYAQQPCAFSSDRSDHSSVRPKPNRVPLSNVAPKSASPHPRIRVRGVARSDQSAFSECSTGSYASLGKASSKTFGSASTRQGQPPTTAGFVVARHR